MATVATCKYRKRTGDIFCKINVPIGSNLTFKEKDEITHSISSEVRNVPRRYEEVYKLIKKFYSLSSSYNKRVLLLTTHGDGSCSIELHMHFTSKSEFDAFIDKTNLKAEEFS